MSSVLERYFALLDARDVDGLVAMFAPDGVMITPGGTGGRPLAGHQALRAFFAGLPPPAATHRVTRAAESDGVSLAEGVARAVPPVYFLASARLDGDGLITRWTSLVWPGLDGEQEQALV
jgi:ketosteroid isomerase-like protein